DREPGRRAVGLAHHHRAVAGGHPAVERTLDVGGSSGRAAVGDNDRGVGAVLELRPGLIRSSFGTCSKAIDLPLTTTEVAVSPRRSRLNRSRSWVATRSI